MTLDFAFRAVSWFAWLIAFMEIPSPARSMFLIIALGSFMPTMNMQSVVNNS